MGTEAAVTIQQAVVRCEPSLAVAADAAPGCQLTVCKPDKHPIAKRTPEVLPRGVGQVGPVGLVGRLALGCVRAMLSGNSKAPGSLYAPLPYPSVSALFF